MGSHTLCYKNRIFSNDGFPSEAEAEAVALRIDRVILGEIETMVLDYPEGFLNSLKSSLRPGGRLWPLRRLVGNDTWLDRTACSIFPNLFGWHILLVGEKAPIPQTQTGTNAAT